MGSHTLNALTVKAIAASKSVKLRDGGGLWLVTKGNGRYWILDYRFGGKRREMGIGPLHTVGLGEARQRAPKQLAPYSDVALIQSPTGPLRRSRPPR